MAQVWYVVLAKNGIKTAVRGTRNAEAHAKVVEGRVLGRIDPKDTKRL